ncbi:tetratricopeptide repeat protein [Merismopedia glauca]|uniref:Cyclic nucleotide-binding protein n=1 Tax=Merismopedia glauca CCAP 1448/3 TaxID=1296344 RepID=A0A2T1C8B4_9CYAN|nr:tetratricopeptide repeat protein [Merismopedia glauca]PSB04484.1 cyclic nucleotide-binding protein [Merismopedia glauca CCAP 1448/3]
MLEQIATAFADKDYQKADALLKEFSSEEPDNPWLHLYLGSLHEATSEWQKAEAIYRQLLQNSTNQKLILEARQGLERLENIACQQREQAIAQAMAQPEGKTLGVLILEGIHSASKPSLAPVFAKIMEIDPQTARLHIPNRGWRLYRQGAIAKMQYYSQQLQQAEIPCFAVPLSQLTEIKVFNVKYFQLVEPENPQSAVQAIGYFSDGKGERETLESFTFNWSQVTQKVEGLLPLFEEVFDIGIRNKGVRKTQILDYVGVWDLQLQAQKTILRLCDRDYQFHQGVRFTSSQNQDDRFSQSTIRLKWNNLLKYVASHLNPLPVWSEFDIFAQSVVDKAELLERFPAHIYLFRRQESTWDAAFHLYSTLASMREHHIK